MGILLKPKPSKKTRMTTQQYFALGPSKEFDTLLIYGELMVMPRPKPKHNRVNHSLSELVDRWVRHLQLGLVFFECDLILDEENALVYAPDLMFLATERLHQYRDELIYGPVDLAVEILSPSNRPYLQERKFADYERYGISWYWVVDSNAENAAGSRSASDRSAGCATLRAASPASSSARRAPYGVSDSSRSIPVS